MKINLCICYPNSKGNFADVRTLEIFKQGGCPGLSHVIAGVFIRGPEAEKRDVPTAPGGRVTCSEDGRRGREPKEAGGLDTLGKARKRIPLRSSRRNRPCRRPAFSPVEPVLDFYPPEL